MLSSPVCSLVGLTLLPILWSYPVGLMTAELGTAFPRDGGYVLWVEAAFGKRAAFQMGWWAWASGVIDTALYPVMFASFLQGTMGAQFSWLTKSIVMSLFVSPSPPHLAQHSLRVAYPPPNSRADAGVADNNYHVLSTTAGGRLLA